MATAVHTISTSSSPIPIHTLTDPTVHARNSLLSSSPLPTTVPLPASFLTQPSLTDSITQVEMKPPTTEGRRKSLSEQQDERIALEGLISLAMSTSPETETKPTQMDVAVEDLPDEVVEEGTQAFRKLREGSIQQFRHNSLPNINQPMYAYPAFQTPAESSATQDRRASLSKITFKRERPYRTRRSVREELDTALRFPVQPAGPSSPVAESTASPTQGSTLLPSIHEALGPLSVMPPPLPPLKTIAIAADAMGERPREESGEEPAAKRTKVTQEMVEIPVTTQDQGEINVSIDKPVLEALSTSGVTPESIVNLIVLNSKDSREQVLKETGFSTNYIMKLQRRVLHSSAELQLPTPVVHNFGPGMQLHVLFDSKGTPLFMKKELCTILGMKGTTFSYWKKKSGVEDTDTSKDFRLMDVCRTLFGGRATYTLYCPQSTLTILAEMETSRQKNTFTNLPQLKYLVMSYATVNGRRSSV